MSADHCGLKDLERAICRRHEVYATGDETKRRCPFGNRPERVPCRRFEGSFPPSEDKVAENSDPPVLTYMFQRNVEIPPSPPAQGCRCPLGQRPLRGRCQRTPSHVAGDPGKGDTERSILDACRNKYSCQLINHALPGAGHETPTVYFAFSHPFAAVIREFWFLRADSNGPRAHLPWQIRFQRPGDAQKRFSSYRFRKTLPVLRRSKDTGGKRNWGDREVAGLPSASISPKPKTFRRTAQRREPSCPDLLRNEPWVGRQLTSQKVVD